MRILIRLFFILFSLCLVTSVSAQEITKKRGKVKLYHPNGKIKAKGKVKNYKKQGEWNYYASEGHLSRKVHFVNDTVDGDYREYSRTSFISVQGTYCMNQKCGNWKTYDPEAHLISDENFNADVANGIQRYWFPTGQLRDSIVYNQGVIQYRKQWYNGGQLKSIETYVNGLAEGRWVVYPEFPVDTFASTVDEYHLGLKHGWHYLWNGRSLIEAYHYSGGLADGTLTRFQYDGKPLVIYHYRSGKLNGKTTYFKDGVTIKEENYVDDVKEGEEIEYNRYVKPSKRTWYSVGEPDSMYVYHTNGQLAIRRLYGGTKGMSNYSEWDPAGILLMKGLMQDEKRIGEWTTYYPNGKVRSTTNYENGRVIGLYTKYYPNGKRMIQYTFLPIGTNTMPDVWNEKGKILKIGSKEYEEIVEGNRPGEIISDPSEYNRRIIDHRINEAKPTSEYGDDLEDLMQQGIGDEGEDVIGEPGEFFLMDVDQALAIAEEDRLKNMDDSGEVYSFCEIMPEYPGGIVAMKDFIQKNIVYPATGGDKEGTVYIEYIVETDGRVSNVKMLRGIPGAPELNEEALRIVGLFPRHEPAKMNGKNVRCRSVVPVRFQLH